MCRYPAFIMFYLFMCETVFALSIDQRQTGDLNVQIDLKNLKIFALTKGKEEYVDYDYAYDYSEMTIKPQNGTTSTTIKPMHTTETVVQTNKDNATVTLAEFEITTKFVENNESITTEKVAITNSTATNAMDSTIATTVRHEASNDTITTTESYKSTTASNCKKGFFRNSQGNCELKLQNPSYTLLKMLQQKTKPSGGNGVRKT